jgi:hypothetical protein
MPAERVAMRQVREIIRLKLFRQYSNARNLASAGRCRLDGARDAEAF